VSAGRTNELPKSSKFLIGITPFPPQCSHGLSSPQGLNVVACILADGTIAARIRSTVELEGAEQMLDKLRNGDLRGKGIIHF